MYDITAHLSSQMSQINIYRISWRKVTTFHTILASCNHWANPLSSSSSHVFKQSGTWLASMVWTPGHTAGGRCWWDPALSRPVATAAGDNEWKWMEILDFIYIENKNRVFLCGGKNMEACFLVCLQVGEEHVCVCVCVCVCVIDEVVCLYYS